MSNRHKPNYWLLLRDGHAVPLNGLRPVDLKEACRAVLKNNASPIQYQSTLNAIVSALGFPGDYGTYEHLHYPALERRLVELGAQVRIDALDVPDAAWGIWRLNKRSLADRLFEGPQPHPTRVFTGHSFDWASTPRGPADANIYPRHWSPADAGYTPSSVSDAKMWVAARFGHMVGQNFISEHLFGGNDDAAWIFPSYRPSNYAVESFELDQRREREVAKIARWVFDQSAAGWFDIFDLSPNLVVLVGHDGNHDFVWRNLRIGAPPVPTGQPLDLGLDDADLPPALQESVSFALWNYRRNQAWAEKEEHEAETYHYAQGGGMGPAYPGSAAVLTRYLLAMGVYVAHKPVKPQRTIPPDFSRVIVGGKTLAIGPLVTADDLTRTCARSDYWKRRGDGAEPLDKGNPFDSLEMPAAATWYDAQAFIAAKGAELGHHMRLMTLEEHREIRPFYNEHYKSLSRMDFPWENWPPRPLRKAGEPGGRVDVPAAVQWSEERFIAPSEDVPEFANPTGVGGTPRKVWHDVFPPSASWRTPLVWTKYSDLGFLDAWDAYEWVGNSRSSANIAGRFWEGPIGLNSWGAYKNCKVGFRLVIDLNDD